jgi:nucleotide-binding universal stress UspA family protein
MQAFPHGEIPPTSQGFVQDLFDAKEQRYMAGTVLCGVNNSAGARNAARVAGALSKRLEFRLVLVHVADGFTGLGGSSRDDESVTTRQARTEGKKLLDQLTAEQGLRGAEQRIEVGDPAERLAQVAAEERAALIVVGTRAHRRLRPTFRSDLSQDIARATPCPVFVIPPAATDRATGNRLLLAVG